MRPTQLFAVLFFLALSLKCHGEAADQCPAQQPIYGKALKGFTFKTLVSPTAFGCLVDCHYEDRCQSYNYVMKTNICEMNNRTKEAKPEQFVSDPDRFYVKRGAHRKQLGSIPALPAQSCKEIKANEGGQAVSSNSWLDPSGSGEVILAYCDMNTEVADFCIRHRCQNGALCVNGHVNYTCSCNVGWTGTFCESSVTMLAKSCSHLKKLDPTAASGTYDIDPDGDEDLPPLYDVTCDMTDKNGVGLTVISHDSENRTLVKGFEDRGSYSRDIQYSANLSQLASLANVSLHCEQFIKYECKGSQMFKNNISHAWWVSRDSVKMTYWGGAEPGSGKCACGMNNTCADPSQPCNCDANQNDPTSTTWREDSGLLTDKTHLPVKQLRFGDTGGTGDNDEKGYHTLGKFKCYGIA